MCLLTQSEGALPARCGPSVADVLLPFQEHEALRYNARIAAIKANLLMSEVRKGGRLSVVSLYGARALMDGATAQRPLGRL